MKKTLIALVLACGILSPFAFAKSVGLEYDTSTSVQEFEFTWAYYEMLCYRFGKEPTIEQYEDLCKNGQCLIVGDEYTDDIVLEVTYEYESK